MSKKKGIISLLVIFATIVAGIYVSVFGLDAAGAGSAAAIKQGLEDSKNKRRTLRSNQDIRYPKKQLPPEALGE